MRVAVLLGLVMLVAACGQKDVPPVANPPSQFIGQETHGGDLAVAMVRSSLMSVTHEPRHRNKISRLMTLPAFSEVGTVTDPLYRESKGLVLVNRARVLTMDSWSIAQEILDPGRSQFEVHRWKEIPHWRGALMTPEKFRARGKDLFSRLETCMRAYSPTFFFPEFSLGEIDNIPVEYAKSPLFDTRFKDRRVDVGVTVSGEPKILLDISYGYDWTDKNYANDYIVFHEYSHVILKKAGRSDQDHVFATMLFLQCSFDSTKHTISGQAGYPL